MLVRKIEELRMLNGSPNRTQWINVIFDNSPDGWLLTKEEAEEVTKLLAELLHPDDTLTYIPGQLHHADRTDKSLPLAENIERECPEYIEPPLEDMEIEWLPKEVTIESSENLTIQEEPIISKSMGAGLDGVKKLEKIRSEYRDYSKYIRMQAEGVPTGKIIDQMRDDFGVSRGSAQNYFYRYVKTDDPAKVTVIEEKKPAPGKFFSDEDRERIQKELRLK